MNKLSTSSAARREARAIAESPLSSLRRTTAVAAIPERPSRPRGAFPHSLGRLRHSRADKKSFTLVRAQPAIGKRSKSSEFASVVPREPILPRSVTDNALLNSGSLHGNGNLDRNRETHKPHTPRKKSGERFKGRARRVSPQQFEGSAPTEQHFTFDQVEVAYNGDPEPLMHRTTINKMNARGQAFLTHCSTGDRSGRGPVLKVSGRVAQGPMVKHQQPTEVAELIQGEYIDGSNAVNSTDHVLNITGEISTGTEGTEGTGKHHDSRCCGKTEVDDLIACNDALLLERLEQAKTKPAEAFSFALWGRNKSKENSHPMQMKKFSSEAAEYTSVQPSEVRIHLKSDEIRESSTSSVENPHFQGSQQKAFFAEPQVPEKLGEGIHRHLVDVKADTPREFQWRLGEQIGRGSFGRVFRGLNERTGELFAVKQVPLHDENTKEAKALVTEISVMKALEHEHIVRYLGTQMLPDQGLVCIFMEYVPGGSIAGMLAQFGIFKEDLIRRYIEQVLHGLEYLHGMGIVHRDIKGANILVSNNGACKLSDFGKRLCSDLDFLQNHD